VKNKPNWKLMKPKDQAKFLAKNGVKTIEMVTNIKLKECQAIYYPFVKGTKATKKSKSWRENQEALRKSRIPREQWVRVKGKDRSRVVL
jgi:hypothetical protein